MAYSHVLSALQAVSDVSAAHQAAYQLTLALQLPFLIAVTAAAFVLRRPGMRGIAVVYTLFSLALIVSAVALHVEPTSAEGGGSPWVSVAVLFLLSAAWATTPFAARALAGREANDRWPSPVRVIGTAVAVSVCMQAMFLIPTSDTWSRLMPIQSARAVIIVLMLWSTGQAIVLARAADRNRAALWFLALAWLSIVARQAFNLASDCPAFHDVASKFGSVIVVHSLATMVNGVSLMAALLVEERAAILEQATLLREQTERHVRAERLESLGRLARGVAHDFANLLAVIGLGVEDMRGNLATLGQSSEVPNLTADAVERATALTRQLRQFAQHNDFAVSRFDAAQRVHEAAPILGRLVGHDVTLRVEVAPSAEVTVEMDPSQFDQVLVNLVVNARDATPKGGTIHVTATREVLSGARTRETAGLPDGPYAHLRVSDTGSGIAADVLDRVFEPSFTTKGDRGTGIGLATVQAVTRQARGHVVATSEVGIGSAFDIWLPEAARLAA